MSSGSSLGRDSSISWAVAGQLTQPPAAAAAGEKKHLPSLSTPRAGVAQESAKRSSCSPAQARLAWSASIAFGCSAWRRLRQEGVQRQRHRRLLQRRVKTWSGIDLATEETLSRPRTAPGAGEELLQEYKAAEMLRKRAATELLDAGSGPRAQELAEVLEQAEKTFADLQAQVDVATQDLAAYPVPEFLPAEGDVNIAVTGNSGVGKSAFINAVRKNLLRGTDDIAETGIFETTKEQRAFRFQKEYVPGDLVTLLGGEHDAEQAEVVRTYVTGQLEVSLQDGTDFAVDPRVDVCKGLWDCWLWDLPGVGTREFPQSEYIRKMGIRHFDLVVLVTATRFTEAEAMLLDELLMWGVPYFVVRNKIDVDIASEALDKGMDVPDILASEMCQVTTDTMLSTRLFLASQLREQLKALPEKSKPGTRVFNPIQVDVDKISDVDLRKAIYCISSRPKFKNNFDMDRLRKDMWATVAIQRVKREEVLDRLRQGNYRFKTLVMGGLARFMSGAARSFFWRDD